MRGLDPSAPKLYLSSSSVPPLMCVPVQQPRDALHIPSPAEVPGLHLCCPSLCSGPGGAPARPPEAVVGTHQGQRLAKDRKPAPLTAQETSVPRAGPSGRQHGREANSGLVTPCLWSRPLWELREHQNHRISSTHWRVWQSITPPVITRVIK